MEAVTWPALADTVVRLELDGTPLVYTVGETWGAHPVVWMFAVILLFSLLDFLDGRRS